MSTTQPPQRSTTPIQTIVIKILRGAAAGIAWCHVKVCTLGFPHVLLTYVFQDPPFFTILYTEQGMIHADIASRNFLLDSVFNCAAADFGLSLWLPLMQQSIKNSQPKPVTWSAPETLSMGVYSKASDVYMFGIFIWEVFARTAPYSRTLLYAQFKTTGDWGPLTSAIIDGMRPKILDEW